MAHEESGGPGWVATFVFSLALWGGILAITVFFGHNLALRVTGH
jgi:hypothetical protein